MTSNGLLSSTMIPTSLPGVPATMLTCFWLKDYVFEWNPPGESGAMMITLILSSHGGVDRSALTLKGYEPVMGSNTCCTT